MPESKEVAMKPDVDSSLPIDPLREALIEAAEEWANYVQEDTAPRTLVEHMAEAYDNALRAPIPTSAEALAHLSDSPKADEDRLISISLDGSTHKSEKAVLRAAMRLNKYWTTANPHADGLAELWNRIHAVHKACARHATVKRKGKR